MSLPDPTDTTITWQRKPVFSLINDGYYRTMVCTEEGLVELGKGGLTLDFPVGWQTDITSSPGALQSFLPQLGPHSPASVVHDRLLDLDYPRAFARKWMRLQLDQLPFVTKWHRWLMVTGVHLYDLMLDLRQ